MVCVVGVGAGHGLGHNVLLLGTAVRWDAVRHEALGPDAEFGLVAVLLEKVEIKSIIGVSQEDWLAGVNPLGNVTGNAC